MAARIILVNASFAPSLIEFRAALLRRMVETGHHVHASAPSLQGAIANELRDMGVIPHNVPLARTGLDPRADLRYRSALRDLIQRHDIDLVLGYTIKPCIWGSLAARDCNVESVSLITGLGYAFIPQAGIRQRLVSTISRFLWGRATRANRIVIFQNPDDRDDFIKLRALIDPVKARLVDGSGVDTNRFKPAPLPDTPRFLMIARLLTNKGVREYGEAAITLRREGLKATFALVGYHDEGPDGIDSRDLMVWCDAGLDYLGQRDDVRSALADCSVYVLPSYREGTPRTVLEAMATGRAVITTDAPGCRETIEHGVSGLLVTPQDVQSLVGAIRKLAVDSALRAKMGQEARKRCVEKYDVDRVNREMMCHLDLDEPVHVR